MGKKNKKGQKKLSTFLKILEATSKILISLASLATAITKLIELLKK